MGPKLLIAFHHDFRRILTVVTAFVCLAAGPIWADGKTNDLQTGARTQQINVSADDFQANTRENFAEFTGNVKAVQGAFEIVSDRLRIYYNAENSDNKEPLLAAEKGEIREIVASGNVRIKADDRVAETEEAVYRMESQELVLSGPNSTLSSEENRIIGSRITFNRNTRQVKIEGKDHNRVSGVFYPKKPREDIKEDSTPGGVVFLTPPPARPPAPNRTEPIAHPTETAPAQTPTEGDTSPADSTGPPHETGSSEPIDEATVEAPQTETAPESISHGEAIAAETSASPPKTEPPAPEQVAASAAVEDNSTEKNTATLSAGAATSVTAAQPEKPRDPPADSVAMQTGAQKPITAGKEETVGEPEKMPAPTVIEIGQSHGVKASGENDGIRSDQAPPSDTAPESPAPLVLARAHSEPLVSAPPLPPAPVPASVVPLKDLTKRVGLALFENTTAFPDKGYGMFMLNSLATAIREENPRLELLLPDSPNYPGLFMDLPRQASGHINNLLLIQSGRRLGLNAIVTGTLADIKIMSEPTGFWMFKGSRVFARVVVQVNVYDTETGTKILDQLLTRKIEMDDADLYMARKGQVPEIPGLEETLAEMAQEVGETIAEKVDGQKWRGFIVVADGDRVTLSAGDAVGLRVGNELNVYDQIPIDGLAGHRYFLPGRKVGTIQITAVYPDRAEALAASGDTIREGLSAADPEDDSAGEHGWARRLKFW